MKANSSYAVSRRVAQSSGIDHCLKANFTSRSDTNLIVSKGAVIQVYTLHEPLEVRNSPLSFFHFVSKVLFLTCHCFELLLLGVGWRISRWNHVGRG